jgi:hypothetical protein
MCAPKRNQIRKVVASALYSFLLSVSPTNAVVAAEHPEKLQQQSLAVDRLQRIKADLLEAAVAAGARVHSLAYLDTQGRLHESTLVTADTVVSGVRMPSYAKEMDIKMGISGNARMPEDSGCKFWSDRSQSMGLVSVLVETGSRSKSSFDSFVNAARNEWQDILVQKLEDGGYNTELIESDSYAVQHATRYDDYMRHNERFKSAGNFQVKVRLEMTENAPPRPLITTNHIGLRTLVPSVDAIGNSDQGMLHLEIKRADRGPALKKVKIPVAFEVKRRYSDGVWDGIYSDPSAIAKLSDVVSSFIDATRCDRRLFPASVAVQGGKVQVRAGLDHGLRQGDWLLVGSRSLIGENIISSSDLDQLMLIKTDRVGARHSSGKPLAGTDVPLPNDTDLVAVVI